MRIIAEDWREKRNIEQVIDYLRSFTVVHDKRDKRNPVFVAYNWGSTSTEPVIDGERRRVFDMPSDVLRQLELISVEEREE